MLERYKIEVHETYMDLRGKIPLHEVALLVRFAQQKGFDSMMSGFEDEICLYKQDTNSVDEELYDNRENMFETLYEQEKSRNESLGERNLQLEKLIQKLLDDQKEGSIAYLRDSISEFKLARKARKQRLNELRI